MILKILGIALIIILIILGLAGVILPVLPGVPLIFLGFIIFGLIFGWNKIGLDGYIILFILTVFSQFSDFILSLIGAKKYKASWYSILLGILFGILGIWWGGILGMITGIFLGIFLGEIVLNKKKTEEAFKIGLAGLVGFIIGTFLRFSIGLGMSIYLIYKVITCF